MKTFKITVTGMVLSAMLILAYSFRAPRAETMLRLDLKKGKVYDYVTKSNMELSAGGQNVAMLMDMAYRMQVTESRADEQVLSCSYQRIKLDVPAMPTLSFDSDNPDKSGEVGKGLKSFVGSPFTVVITSEGKVKEVKGLREMAEKLQGASAETLSQYLDEDAVKKQLEQAFNYLPNKAVGEGDTWQKEQSIPGQLPVKSLTTYKVKSIAGKKISLEFNSKVTHDPSAPVAPGMEGAILKGDTKGTMELDKASGFPLSSEGTMNVVAEKDGAEIMRVKGSSTVQGTIK